jgi:hypothetical protein
MSFVKVSDDFERYDQENSFQVNLLLDDFGACNEYICRFVVQAVDISVWFAPDTN